MPAASGPRVVRALIRAGFVPDRVAGSHHVLKYPGDPTRAVVVPCHSARDLKPGTLRGIIRQAGLTVEEFSGLLMDQNPRELNMVAGHSAQSLR